ncbi:MAG: hypothetical protein IJW17_12645, partial [Lentisphaeria bacterium]|nr:hypothetical protein [Lentisphaeria bacterium]
MTKIHLYLLLLALPLFFCGGAEHVKINSNGALEVGSALIRVVSKETSGRLQEPNRETFIQNNGVVSKDNQTEFSAKLKFSVGEFDLNEKLFLETPGKYLFTAKLSAQETVKVNELTLLITFPAGSFAGKNMTVNGQKITLPEKFTKRHIFSAEKLRSISWVEGDTEYTISGSGNIQFQDARCDRWNSFPLFTRFTPFMWKVKNAVNKLTVTTKPVRITPLPLAAVCNMGFADDTAGDGKGGWTDQGGSNDLRVFSPGRHLFNDVIFDVVAPEGNQGKSCVVLSKNITMKFPDKVVVPTKTTGKYLSLLHAAAYVTPEIGTVELTYADKTTSVFKVEKGKHVSDWWVPGAVSDGEVVWSAMNDSSLIGLYGCSFPLKEQPIEKITFSTTGGAVWMIVAATVSDIPISRVQRTPVYTMENAEWRKIDFPRSIRKGSVLDFSLLGLQDAPAGKYGSLKTT